MKMGSLILAIESSCDETSAAVLEEDRVLSNIISSQLDHGRYGGVIPELASRLHQQNIIKVVGEALSKAGIRPDQLSAVAFTRGPGLLGSLLVGTSFAKSFALGLGIPLIDVNHMQAHLLANFLLSEKPAFPLLCLTVSGGHTQLVYARSPLDMEIIGQTIDDAAGEAFDKAAALLGLGYPGGPAIDRLAADGNPAAFGFPKPSIAGLDFSFSGIKTSFLYFLRRHLEENPDFIQQRIHDICASWQFRIVEILIDKTRKAASKLGVENLAIAGGVSANSALRKAFTALCLRNGWKGFIPPIGYCTDNAAMIGIAAWFKMKENQFAGLDAVPFTREIM